MIKVFIDGSAGTTGLKIVERMEKREDVLLLSISEDKRKDPLAKKEILNQADVVFLCLPDEAAKESVSLIDNPSTVVIDTSTAHRTNPDWVYGLLELGDEVYESVKSKKRICVPGCHASGFIALVNPLIESGLVPKDYPFSCTSLTGYSGGGKAMIADYEDIDRDPSLSLPRIYALGQEHKHLKEMKHFTKISNYPSFTPIVLDIYSMMCVIVNIEQEGLEYKKTLDVFKKKYEGRPLIKVEGNEEVFSQTFLPTDLMKNKDSMVIKIGGKDGRISLMALYDNLGKGASGAALQCFNVLTGCDETSSLNI